MMNKKCLLAITLILLSFLNVGSVQAKKAQRDEFGKTTKIILGSALGVIVAGAAVIGVNYGYDL